jgi:glycine/D-amino acid oxidase-like deaminating enzyme
MGDDEDVHGRRDRMPDRPATGVSTRRPRARDDAAAMRRSAHGYWIEEAGGGGTPLAAPTADARADHVVIGGGYLGLWTAWQLARDASARVVLLEADRCGFGPSGRNGGFVSPLWDRLDEMAERWGTQAALAVGHASDTAVDGIGAWCAEHGADAWFHRAAQLEVATNERQLAAPDGATAACTALGVADRRVALTGGEARARCDSPRFLGATASTHEATVQPARLAFALRDRLAALPNVTVHEHAPVVALDDRDDGVTVTVAGGVRVAARSAALCVNTATAAVAPLRHRFAVASSHLVITEPVPDVVAALGWAGGESITDGPTLIHYTRTTPDGRIAFGWAGGHMGYGARRPALLDVDPATQDRTARELVWMFPGLAGRRIEHAWGGPIDVSPLHLPLFGTLRSTHWGAGFTGNGVGPSHLGGRILADLCRDDRTELTRLALVDTKPKRFPPEPLRWVGGTLTRAALLRVDAAEKAGRAPDPVSRLLSAVPGKLGLHLPR